MFDNIGGKIKMLAKVIFVIQSIAAIIAGLVIMIAGFGGLGFLIMLLGPIVAFLSTWVLYAFGELVEKTCDNEENTRKILAKLNQKDMSKTSETSRLDEKPTMKEQPVVSKTIESPVESKEEQPHTTIFSSTEIGTIICSRCKYEQDSSRKVCWQCGAKFERERNPSSPYWCGQCGHEGPYYGNCPNCGSSLKKYNV